MEAIVGGDNPFKLMRYVNKNKWLFDLYENKGGSLIKIVEKNGVLYQVTNNHLYQLTKKKSS